MANSPIQVVLNASDFMDFRVRPQGGGVKDFYEGNDLEFVSHKAQIVEQLSRIKDEQLANAYGKLSVAKVRMKQSAMAKSHRPTSVMFRPDIARVIGGAGLGELFVELTPQSIDLIASKVLSAEDRTKWVTKDDGKKVASPSPIRSEVGAIEEILPYAKEDKRKFSVKQAVEWLSDPVTGGAYYVELFEIPLELNAAIEGLEDRDLLYRSFYENLRSFETGLDVAALTGGDSLNLVSFRLHKGENPVHISLAEPYLQEVFEAFDDDISKHASLIGFLDGHPLVKKVNLPPKIQGSSANQVNSKRPIKMKNVSLPAIDKNRSYPIVGVVDGGVSSAFDSWILHRWGFLAPNHKEEEHGTFISGLLVAGQHLNGSDICSEPDGCVLVDLDILPIDKVFDKYYPTGLEGFFNELDAAIKEVKEHIPVRIINFSINIEEYASASAYSYSAMRLDRIAEENDVIFVISAGNTDPKYARKEWPTDRSAALSILAASRNDLLQEPAESFRNLSVAALNPPNLPGVVPFAPSGYSCRGPKIDIGVKPDLAHVGGCQARMGDRGHGLLSFDSSGGVIDDCGTSFAAPNVAKTISMFDHVVEGVLPRETLIALAVHNSSIPEVLTHKDFDSIAKHMVGFGVPSPSTDVLDGAVDSITLVFSDRIMPGKKMSFGFSWPPSLVNNGKCSGFARLTVVSTPPFDHTFGAEFVRVNIEAYLRQSNLSGDYKGRLEAVHVPKGKGGTLTEKNLIEHSSKWSPIKMAEKLLPRGVGETSNWRLDVEYLERDGTTIPTEGIPFCAILTIKSLGGKPIFSEMRNVLQSQGVRIADIKTAARIRGRI